MTNSEILSLIRQNFKNGQKVLKIVDNTMGEKFNRSVECPDIIICEVLVKLPEFLGPTDEFHESKYVRQKVAFNETTKQYVGTFEMERIKKENLDVYL